MDLKRIHEIVDFLVDKEQNGHVSHEEIDMVLDRAQMALFNDYYNNPRTYSPGRQVPVISYGNSQRINDALSPFKKTFEFTDMDTEGGLLALPSDYMYMISLYTVTYDSDAQRNIVRPVQVLNEEELINRLESQVVPVSKSDPICLLGSQKKIQLYPEVRQTGKVMYFKRPIQPQFIYSQSGRSIVYNQNSSVQLEWGEQDITNIINKAVGMLGINLSSPDIMQYAMAKDKMGE